MSGDTRDEILSTQHGYAVIAEGRPVCTNEEELRSLWKRGIEVATGAVIHAERAHRDLSRNNVIIELKSPGSFNGSETSQKFKEATYGRLLPYIKEIAVNERVPEEEYVGIATDGDHVSIVRVSNDELTHLPLMPFSLSTFQMVADAFRNGARRALTAKNLLEDFGHGSPRGRAFMRASAETLAVALDGGDPKAAMMFKEWANLYGQAADLSLQRQTGLPFMLETAGGLPAQLFVVHTYHSFLIKLISAEIVASNGLAASPSLVGYLLSLGDDNALLEAIRYDLEGGRFVCDAGIRGFDEEIVFSWYLGAKSSPLRSHLAKGIRDVLAGLAMYRFESAGDAARSRDVLRDFYQGLVPETLRKSLGEFYTPDWLVEFTVNGLNNVFISDADWVKARLLDPTCGSGSFLLEIIVRKRAAASRLSMSSRETVKMLLETVWGFDINPLAVQTARANFLMAIADLLKTCPGLEVEMPVLLADAIYSPAEDPLEGRRIMGYDVGGLDSDLHVNLPEELVRDRALLDKVFQRMGDGVEKEVEYDEIAKILTNDNILTAAQAEAWNTILHSVYDMVLNLHKKHWNGIWFRVFRNFFRSATAGSFDAVVGNPPWVRWSNLPESYRNRAKPTCMRYGIFSDTRFHGGNELDISAMITYTVADKWLKDNGQLAFIITQTVFQSPSSQGFRRFHLNAKASLRPLVVDDMKALRPFPDATNKTAVARFTKVTSVGPSPYPVAYNEWRPRSGNGKSAINPALPLDEVMSLIEASAKEANPVCPAMPGSPWAIMGHGEFQRCQPLFAPSLWAQGRKGVTVDLNGLYYVELLKVNLDDGLALIMTCPSAGKSNIGPARKLWVESDALYPLAKGAGDISPCRFSPKSNRCVIMTNRGIDAGAMKQAELEFNRTNHHKLYEYFLRYETMLRNRSTYRLRIKDGPFFAAYNVGDYTFAPYKVLWPEITAKFKAAVATSIQSPSGDRKPFIPDHKLYFMDFHKPEPAYFLCGLLNSPTIKKMVAAHTISTNLGNLFKHIAPPPFDASEGDHRLLADLVCQCHVELDAKKRQGLLKKVEDVAESIIGAFMMTR